MAMGDVQQMLEAGIAAARAGDRERARELLAQAVRQDPNNEQNWLWLAGVVDRPEETIYCLEQALILNPNNDAARRGITWARQRLAASAPATPSPARAPSTAPPPTPAPVAAPSPTTPPQPATFTPPAMPTPEPPVAMQETVVSDLRATLSAPPKWDEPDQAPPAPAEEEPDTLAARLAAGTVSLPRWESRGLASLRSLESVEEMLARGNLALDQGRIEEAADIFRGAIARQPDHAQAHAQLAVTFYHQGDKQGSLVEFENAIAADPDYVEAHYSLGVVYEELGETKAAIHCWERVLELDPTHADARESLENARGVQGSRYQCPSCGATLSGLEPSCPQCGRLFFVRCANCGEYAEEKEETCPRCGAPLREAAPPPGTKEDEKPEEAQGPQIACLRCGSLNPAYHTRCATCGAPIGDTTKSTRAEPFPRSRRRLRLVWLLITLLSWVAACGLCLWGAYTGYQIVPLADLGTTDPMGVAGDLLAQRTNESVLVVAALGSSLLLGFVGRIGLRRARS